MAKEVKYLDTQADAGITKHMGGLKATKKIIELAHIKDKHVLDIGCGIGLTPCYLAKRQGCRVVGVDISPKMISWSKKNAIEEGVADKLSFKTADAQKLPFRDETFDVVLVESVYAFVNNKAKALSEAKRVLKKGGLLCLNEAVWLKPSPPKTIVDYMRNVLFHQNLTILTYEAWLDLLKEAGMRKVFADKYTLSFKEEMKDRIAFFGLKRMFAAWLRIMWKILTDGKYRSFMLTMIKAGKAIPVHFMRYFGYGLYVYRK